MKKFAIIALAVLVALPASAAGVTINGYLDLGFVAAQGGHYLGMGGNRVQAAASTNGGWSQHDQFVVNELNLDLAAQLTNDISLFASLDVDPAAIGIDYAYLDFANPGPFDLNVRVGRIPSVIGIEQRASESNQTKFISLSLMSPYTVGALEGVALYGSLSPVNYAFAISNTDIAGNNGVALQVPGNRGGVANIASYNDNNSAYALSGRIGVVPVEGLELGVSGSRERISAIVGGRVIKGFRGLVAGDAAYSWGAFTLRGEYGLQGEDVLLSPAPADIRTQVYTVEGIYDVNTRYSVAARYSSVRVRQTEGVGVDNHNGVAQDVNTLSLAGVYRVADNVQLKAQYDINREKVFNSVAYGTQIKNNVIALSLVASF